MEQPHDDVNRQWFVEYARRTIPPGGRVLDYGCGAGRARLLYTTALRRLGFGKFKDERPAKVWAEEKLEWIDDWTVYRPEAEILALFGRNSTVATVGSATAASAPGIAGRSRRCSGSTR